jgi:hypothetical protein
MSRCLSRGSTRRVNEVPITGGTGRSGLRRGQPSSTFSGAIIMTEILKTEGTPAIVPLQEEELRSIVGGVSIYVDGVYWGEGTFDYWPWPGGRSSTGAPVVFN